MPYSCSIRGCGRVLYCVSNFFPYVDPFSQVLFTNGELGPSVWFVLVCLQWIRTYFLGYFSRCSEGVCFCFVVSFAGLFLLFEVLSGHILVCALVFYAVLLSDCMFRMRDCLEVANSCLAHVLCSLAFTKCYSVIFLQNVAYVQMFVVFRIGRW